MPPKPQAAQSLQITVKEDGLVTQISSHFPKGSLKHVSLRQKSREGSDYVMLEAPELRALCQVLRAAGYTIEEPE